MRHDFTECCVESRGINAPEIGIIWSLKRKKRKKNALHFLNFHLEVYEMLISCMPCLSSAETH